VNFHDFKVPVHHQFQRLTGQDIFCVDVGGDELWQHYLASFPAGTNPIYRERTEHDCSCCRQFVKTVGGVVAIVDGELHSIWDAAFDEPAYQAVANAMGRLVKSRPIDRPFLHYEKHVGTDQNHGLVNGAVETYQHFHVEIPWANNAGKNFFCPAQDIPTKIGELKSTHDVMLRSLTSLSRDGADYVLDLIAKKSLYRGVDQDFAVKILRQTKTGI
jgi:hypothetical protein